MVMQKLVNLALLYIDNNKKQNVLPEIINLFYLGTLSNLINWVPLILLIHRSQFLFELLQEMIAWCFKKYCIINAMDRIGSIIFEENCDCDDELDTANAHIGVTKK